MSETVKDLREIVSLLSRGCDLSFEHKVSTMNCAANEIEKLQGMYRTHDDTIKSNTRWINHLAAENQSLKEQLRWRKWVDEKPKHGEMVLIKDSGGTSNPTMTFFTSDPIAGDELHWKGMSYMPYHYDLWLPISALPTEGEET